MRVNVVVSAVAVLPLADEVGEFAEGEGVWLAFEREAVVECQTGAGENLVANLGEAIGH